MRPPRRIEVDQEAVVGGARTIKCDPCGAIIACNEHDCPTWKSFGDLVRRLDRCCDEIPTMRQPVPPAEATPGVHGDRQS